MTQDHGKRCDHCGWHMLEAPHPIHSCHKTRPDRVTIAMECHAQLIRFVKRGEITSEQAASMALKHADALIDVVERSPIRSPSIS